MLRNTLFSIGFFCLLTGCSASPAPLPTGVQTVSGTLVKAPLSLVRRGTHLLKQNGKNVYYVESTQASLQAEDGVDVVLQGTLEPNADPDALPVLVVQKILKGRVTGWKKWASPSLGVSFEIPKAWEAPEQGDRIRFVSSGSSLPSLVVFSQSSADLPFQFRTLTATGTTSLSLTPMVVAGRKAVRVRDTDHQQMRFHVELSSASPDNPSRVLTLLYALHDDRPFDEQEREFTHMIESMSLPSLRPPAQSSGSGAAATGQPCGGPAGILCPSGYYCLVTDTETDTGKCTKM